MKKENFPNDGNHLTDGILSLVCSSDRTPSGKKMSGSWEITEPRPMFSPPSLFLVFFNWKSILSEYNQFSH
jgi:hypothetical protein